MDFDGNFISQGHIDVAALRELVLAEPETRWTQDESRQQEFDAHADTHTIFLIYDPDFRHIQPTKRERFAIYEPVVSPIFAHLASRLCVKGWCVRCLLTRLRPGGRIPPHVDAGFSLARSHRVHIPIVTHGDVNFSVGGERLAMQEGDAWEINNMRVHAVENTGAQSRVHLIIDWACPGERPR